MDYLLSVYSDAVVGIYLNVVDSGRCDSVWFRITTRFCCVDVGIGFCDVYTFGVVICGVDAVEWNDVAVVGNAPNEKCGIVFWSMLFSTISGSTNAASS